MRKVARIIITAIIVMITLLMISLAPRVFGWSTWTVTGPSMEPSYYNGDLLIGKSNHGIQGNKHDEAIDPIDSDVVIIKTGTWKTKASDIVKRVVASHGDEITIDEHGRLHNGASVNDPLVDQRENDYNAGCQAMDGKKDGKTIMVSSGKIFVRGDNVNVSADSRHALCNGEEYLVDVRDVETIVTAVLPLGRFSMMVAGGID